MPASLSPGRKGAILALHSQKLSYNQIVEALKNRGINVSYRSARRVVKTAADEARGLKKPPKRLGPQCQRNIRNSTLIRKVKSALNVRNPPSHRQLAKRLRVSASLIRTILKEDIDGKVRQKGNCHALSDKQVQQRLAKGPKFLRWISKKNLPYIITVDEAWVTMTHVNGQRGIYYQFGDEPVPQSWKKKWRQAKPQKIMFVGGICSRGVTKLRFILPGAKINSDYYIQHFLKPLVEEDIPKLFPGEEHLVIVHQDSAPAHASKKTQEWLRNCPVQFIPKEDWMGNSPDLAPMDYGINGIFKQALFGRKAKTLKGLKRVMVEEWKRIPFEKIENTINAWPKRVKTMIKNRGFQIEPLSKNSR